MIASSPSLCDYRGAIALCNMGVTLLKRRCYQQALYTLKDAIFVMKLVFPLKSGQLNTEKRSSHIDAKMHRAIGRMARPEPMSACSPITVNIVTHGGDDGDLSGFKSIIGYGPVGNTMVHAIRIDYTDFDEPNESCLDVESSIMIYNFGVAHVCMANASKKASTSTKLFEGSLKIFMLSQSILSSRCELCVKSSEQLRVLVVATMVLYNLVQVLATQGKVTEASEAKSKLMRLASIVRAMDDPQLLAIYDSKLKTAPAA